METNTKLTLCAKLTGETARDLMERLVTAELKTIGKQPIEIAGMILHIDTDAEPSHHSNR